MKTNQNNNFAGIPHAVMRHEVYIKLSFKARALLLEAALQYRGTNNGDITLAWTILKTRGFKSQDTLSKAKKELIEAGFIIETRKAKFGDPKKKCSLYALSWRKIDPCSGKNLNVKQTKHPPKNYKE